MVEHTPEYMTAMQRFYDNHPDELSQAHRAHLGGLGISEEAQAELVPRNAPELAHAKGIEAIGARPKSEHAKAVAELHARESRGSEQDDNAETERYLAERGKRMPGHARRQLVRN
ncbi:MAG TPA: hypothetical protein VF749_17290 [Candidatus Acidoferrum sp.]